VTRDDSEPEGLLLPVPSVIAFPFWSRLGERLARTPGAFCRRDVAEVLGGSKLPDTMRGLGLGGGAPALDWTRALPNGPDMESGGPKRGALGEDSTLSLLNEVRDDDGCKGECDRLGEETEDILCKLFILCMCRFVML